MKLKNISNEEQKVMPPDSAAFSCAPCAETPELSDVCGGDLLASFPSVWESTSVKPKKAKKAGDK